MSDQKREWRSKPPPARKHPAHGVAISQSEPTIVFLTVCTKDRKRCLAHETVHEGLCTAWRSAELWHVGRYVIMPDHIHLFASPTETDVDLDGWIRFWKSCFTKEIRRSKSAALPPRLWQSHHWDTRLRNWRSYDNKWTYVRNNPVRHGLVTRADDWPYQGEIHELRWD